MRLAYLIEVISLARACLDYWYFIPLVLIFSSIILKKSRGKVVGFLIYSFNKIHYLAVHKKHRKKGIGKMLLKKAVKKANYLTVHPKNRIAINFYRRFGFKRKKIAYTLWGKRIYMELINNQKKSASGI